MWLRLALKTLALIWLISACSPHDRQAVDKLNALSYAYHYRNIDSTELYANEALKASSHYQEGKAEALNNLAFVRIVQMKYKEAKQLLDQLPETTDNQLELLIGYIQQMRLCQRMSHNRNFYDYREQALRALARISEDREHLSERSRSRLLYAESELAIVTSTYYYYIGLERESAQALKNIPQEIEKDTAQYLNYLYNIGSGGMITEGTSQEIYEAEMDHLTRCYQMADKAHYPYFKANSMEALAEHLSGSDEALSLAAEALDIFGNYGDTYQIAGAYRTLASCYLAQDRYEEAIASLQLALADTTINQAPDLVASIREQMSVAYAAVDDKPQSDYNRNIYLDLQETTRQDRSLEARAGQLEQSVSKLNTLLWALAAAILLLALLIVFYAYRHRHHSSTANDEEWKEREDELSEQLALARLHVENGQRFYLEQRAKISMVNGITPFIDRIIYAIGHKGQLDYVRELTDEINLQNDVLTHWIQLRQGELNIHVETFPLQQIFDLVSKSKTGFRLKNITLDVEPTSAYVKADKVLTLFMLNTLADNARKFTQKGGHVSISAKERDDCVEISVRDNGVGMSDEQLMHIFEHHAIRDEQRQTSHGFGLLNCKGIIEKYRKVSSIFKVCALAAESREGQGSRFFFRLPKGILKTIVTILSIITISTAGTIKASAQAQSYAQSRAAVFADSAYFSNINGTYERTLIFADSCRRYLNECYRQLRPASADTLLAIGDLSIVAPEINWYHDSLNVNYNIILDIRNESAVAALALHEWPLYYYNNRIYTQLFKEMSADKSLAVYCRKMQQSETNTTIAIMLLVLIFVVIVAAMLWQVMQALNRKTKRQIEHQDRLELMTDELQRIRLEEDRLHVANAVLDNCLSTLKHETMYYPSRIRQLIDTGNTESLSEVVSYYRELYGILSQQAMRQVEHLHLRLRPLEQEILGDETLIRYLFDILRKQSGEKQLNVSYEPKGDKYVVCTVDMPNMQLTETQAAALFTPAGVENIPYLLCRQIVRDHGEATNRRGCAIRAEDKKIIISLPRKA